MFDPMKRYIGLFFLALVAASGFTSCAGESDPKPAGPVSDTSRIPWNAAIPGQGQGQLGQLPQTKYYR